MVRWCGGLEAQERGGRAAAVDPCPGSRVARGRGTPAWLALLVTLSVLYPTSVGAPLAVCRAGSGLWGDS